MNLELERNNMDAKYAIVKSVNYSSGFNTNQVIEGIEIFDSVEKANEEATKRNKLISDALDLFFKELPEDTDISTETYYKYEVAKIKKLNFDLECQVGFDNILSYEEEEIWSKVCKKLNESDGNINN